MTAMKSPRKTIELQVDYTKILLLQGWKDEETFDDIFATLENKLRTMKLSNMIPSESACDAMCEVALPWSKHSLNECVMNVMLVSTGETSKKWGKMEHSDNQGIITFSSLLHCRKIRINRYKKYQ